MAYRDAGDGRLLVLTNSRWRVNLRGRPQVGVTLLGKRHAATAELVEDPQVVAGVYRTLIEHEGHRRTRRLGIRVNVKRLPTILELEDAACREGLSLVYLHVDRDAPC